MIKFLTLFAFTLVAIFVIGCGTSPTPTPATTPTSQVITVVITATQPPPTATLAQPTMTPISTVALTATTPVTTPVAIAQATKAPVTPKPAATKAPTKIAATATATALPIKYGAPVLNYPVWENKDEVKFDGSDIIFNWQSLGGLQGDECYLIQVRTEPVNGGGSERSDYWLASCADQTAMGYPVKFTLWSPKRGSPNYDSVKTGSDQMWAHWSVTVVKNLGQCDASKLKCKYAPLSPTSTNYFLFKGS